MSGSQGNAATRALCHVSVLLEGSRAWDEWRCAHPDVVPDLSYADLEDVRTDVDFTDRGMKVVSLNLRGAQMQGARLSRGGFGSADFEMANLRGADLTSNKFDAAIFRDADLQQARLVGASFRIFTVRQAGSFCQTNDLTSIASVNDVVDVIKAAPVVEVAGSDFTHAKMRGADMREAKLNGSIFIGADLTDADLRDADLSRVDLSDANLSQADL